MLPDLHSVFLGKQLGRQHIYRCLQCGVLALPAAMSKSLSRCAALRASQRLAGDVADNLGWEQAGSPWKQHGVGPIRARQKRAFTFQGPFLKPVHTHGRCTVARLLVFLHSFVRGKLSDPQDQQPPLIQPDAASHTMMNGLRTQSVSAARQEPSRPPNAWLGWPPLLDAALHSCDEWRSPHSPFCRCQQ